MALVFCAKRPSPLRTAVQNLFGRFAGEHPVEVAIHEFVARGPDPAGEPLLGLRLTEESGPVVSLGLGGLDVEQLSLWEPLLLAAGEAWRSDSATVLADHGLTRLLSTASRGRSARVAPARLARLLDRMLELGTRSMPPLLEGKEFSLAWLTRLREYTFAGADVIGVRRCHRLDFGPASAGELGGDVDRAAQRFLEVLSGRLCVDPQTLHLVHAHARTLRPVPLSFGLAKILELEIELEGRPVADAAWLPREIIVDSHLSILGRDVRKRNRFTYSNYRPIPARTDGPESGMVED